MNEFGAVFGAITSALSDGVVLGLPMAFVLSNVKSKYGLGVAASLAAVSYLVVIVPLQMLVISRVPYLEFNLIRPVFGLAVCVPLMLGMMVVLEQFRAYRNSQRERREKAGQRAIVRGA